MANRLWTAIMTLGHEVQAHECTFSYDAETARHDIEAEHPGWKVVALVPGKHTSGMYTFGSSKKMSAQQSVDVWSVGEFYSYGKVPNCS